MAYSYGIGAVVLHSGYELDDRMWAFRINSSDIANSYWEEVPTCFDPRPEPRGGALLVGCGDKLALFGGEAFGGFMYDTWILEKSASQTCSN